MKSNNYYIVASIIVLLVGLLCFGYESEDGSVSFNLSYTALQIIGFVSCTWLSLILFYNFGIKSK